MEFNEAIFRARAEKILGDLSQWAKRCHEASLALVKAGIARRVARGTCAGVRGQHSWAVCGENCYDDETLLIDPTLWSYDDEVEGVWIGTLSMGKHRPHGYGNIWNWGKPAPGGDSPITLKPKSPFSKTALSFLTALGPLDLTGWMRLASNAPVQGWPAGEILAAIADTPGLEAVVPVDRIGMLTDRNPGGLYLP